MSNRITTKHPSMDQIETVEAVAQEMSRAIELGDKETAMECARNLAEKHAPVTIQVKEAAFPQHEIKLRVGVEDSQSHGTSITMDVFPYMTIATLKSKVHNDYRFHPKLQQWIIAHRLAKDNETLHFHGIRKDGDTAFMYLLSAKQANITVKQQEQDWLLLPQQATEIASATLSPKPNNVDVLLKLEPRGTQVQVPKAAALPEAPPKIGWECLGCTYINKPTRPGCEMCSTARPDNYQIPNLYQPDEEELQRMKNEEENYKQYEQSKVLKRQQNYKLLLETDEQNLISTGEDFECPICLNTFDNGEDVTLRECLHPFCKDCLKRTILSSTEADVTCPFMDENYSCQSKILEREIKYLLTEEEYRLYLDKSLAIAENRSANSYHCQTPDCKGWCIYEDDVNEFDCPICNKKNCLVCKAIHEGMDCKQYQDDLKIQAENNKAAKQTADMLTALLDCGEAMKCPQCKIVVQKKSGCDWLRCTMCKTEICWVTKGARWGPLGAGDTSAGCRCRVNGRPCHPNCQNCH
ncbi:LOW QUALITY PROTEIN: ranBP-type and C3HC4-type zinc finger-containing protein 1-like [Scyliorhinus canicula]|uniref:LOW QUALITY PROTEIN: ranBP-type and C3HC4-type zinc finger-containing protein 1-like n=1 Tax=Scyliorhinus canicula TaxID=7830 RepID=UPI0018F740E0|nr:LOW QUALITY PROTEIN: ranBP-type and C3HC4-type zinc finger-containing protein 1-like [Scyliorhinus canicula]